MGNTDKPFVSVAMCTYNGEKYLRQQLDSVCNQAYKNLELVIFDDCSTDNTLSILKEYAEKDNRIKVTVNEKNLGYNKNFEKAFHNCRGQYIFISDQDDIWDLNKIEVMLESCSPNAVFVYSVSKDFTGAEPVFGEENKPIIYFNGDKPEKLCFDSPIHGHACMFKPELLKAASPFPENVYYDWWLSVIASATGKISFINKTLTYHRLLTHSSSRAVLSVPEKAERNQKLRNICIAHNNAFLKADAVSLQSKKLIKKYTDLLEQKKNDSFTWGLFLFFFKNREIVFHYKRKKNVFSLLKNSFKRAFTGIN